MPQLKTDFFVCYCMLFVYVNGQLSSAYAFLANSAFHSILYLTFIFCVSCLTALYYSYIQRKCIWHSCIKWLLTYYLQMEAYVDCTMNSVTACSWFPTSLWSETTALIGDQGIYLYVLPKAYCKSLLETQRLLEVLQYALQHMKPTD